MVSPSNRKSYHTSIDHLFGLCTISRWRKVGHKAIQEPTPIRSGLLDPRQPFPVRLDVAGTALRLKVLRRIVLPAVNPLAVQVVNLKATASPPAYLADLVIPIENPPPE